MEKKVNPAGKGTLQGTSLVGMLSDHFSVLKSSPDKFSGSNSFLPNIPELIDHWKSAIKETNEPDKRFFLKLKLIDELTRCNRNEEALSLIQETQGLLELFVPESDRERADRNLRFFKALALFRIDERKCCYEGFRNNACIFPVIDKDYLFTTGNIKKANEIWGKLLREQPWDYRTKWMFNLSSHLIGNETERKLRGVFPHKIGDATTPGDIETSNVSGRMNLHCEGLAGGVIVEDFDQNGLQDVFRTSWYFNHNCQLLLQTEPGRFSEQTGQFMLDGEVGGLNCVSTDYNNDGYVDILILRGGWLDGLGLLPNSLLKNVNGKHFENVSFETGLTSAYPSHSAVWADFNNDGWLDLYASAYFAGVEDVATEHLGQPHAGEVPRLYRNNGDGTFTDVATAMGLDRIQYVMGSNYGDLDSDGYPDFYVGTGDPVLEAMMANRMFRNDAGQRFQEVTTSGGFGHFQKGHGVSFGDIDNDGDQDILVNMGGGYPADLGRNLLFENPGHGHHWVTLRLEGVASNRDGLGARVRLTVDMGGEAAEFHKLVDGGGSFGANSLQLEIGLGVAEGIREIAITWPTSGRTDVYADVEMDRVYRAIEGAAELEALTVPSFTLGSVR